MNVFVFVLIKNGKCKIIVSDRNYTAPMGLSVKGDMKYAAKGVDDWVKIDWAQGPVRLIDRSDWRH